MVDSNKIGSLTRTWPTPPIKKDRHEKNNSRNEKIEEKPKSKDDEPRDPGDTIIDEYV